MMKIDVPAAEAYRLVDLASELTAKGQMDAAITEWKKVLELDPGNAKAYTYIGEILLWQGNAAAAKEFLQQGREIDPGAAQAEIDLGIELSYREQFNAAIESSDCEAAASYGKEILAVVPDDAEVKRVLGDCTLHQTRRQMRQALAKSDCEAALSLANKILAAQPGDDESQKAVKACNQAVSGPR
jgi:tetratricopeptide (TPR) repeat protein